MRMWHRRGLSHSTRTVILFLVLVYSKLGLAASSITPSAQSDITRPKASEAWLAVHINHRELHETALVLHRSDGQLLARAEDIERWRLRLPNVPPFLYQDETFFPLDAVAGLSYRLDGPRQALWLEADPSLFRPTRIEGSTGAPAAPGASPLGGFINYDVFAQYLQGRAEVDTFVELGAFNSWGVGTSDFLARDLGGDSRLIRLETTWTLDQPERLASYRLGDTISRAGLWGRSVRMGGGQWTTNFATRPDLVTFPLPSLRGEAALPSTVDLYVNDALRLRREVEAGPFTVTELPLVTGQGEVRVVVSDLLGRQTVVTQPYYASPLLLRRGLQDYSYELGAIRENFGLASNDYGRFLAVGTHRLGWTDHTTREVHAELLSDQQTLGLGGVFLWPETGVFTAALAGSRSRAGEGGQLTLGFERQGRWLSFGGRAQIATDRFAQVGLLDGDLAPRQVSQVFSSIATGRHGALGLSYTRQDHRGRDDVELFNASYSLNLGRLGALHLSVIHSFDPESDTAVGLTFTRALDGRTSASVNATLDQRSNPASAQVQRNLPPGSGVGYRLLGGYQDTERLEAGVSLQNDVGTYALEAARFGGETALRGNASGGVAVMGARPFFARRLTESFAVVEVPDHPNVRVYKDNQWVATTDGKGNALLPSLRPYEKNPIRIEQADLPLDAQVDTLESEAVPYFRSGLRVRFPVQRARGALLRIVLEDGQPLPAGATVEVIGQRQQFPTALRGEVYLTGLAPRNRLRASWRGQRCELDLPYPETTEPLPDLGTFSCKGVRR